MDVCVELLAYYEWEADYHKPGFLSVSVDSSDRLFLYRQPMSLPMVENSNKIENRINDHKYKTINKSKNTRIWILKNGKIIFFDDTPYG